MILTCQKCSTSFKLDETLLKSTGSKVRCSLCQNMWVAFPPETPSEDLPAPADGDLALGTAAAAVTGAAVGAVLADAADEADIPADTPPEMKFFADEDFEEGQNYSTNSSKKCITKRRKSLNA